MNEKLNIQFRIKAVDKFSATLERAEQQLRTLERHADRSHHVNIHTGIWGYDGAMDELDVIDRRVERLDGSKVFVDFMSEGFSRVMGQIETFKSAIPKDRTISVKYRVTKGIEQSVERIRAALEGFEDVEVETKFEQVGMLNALAEFKAFKAARPKSAVITTRFKITGATSKQIDDMRESMTKLRQSAEDLGRADIDTSNFEKLVETGKDLRSVTKEFREMRREVNKPLKPKVDTDEALSNLGKFRKGIQDTYRLFQSRMGKMATLFRNFGEVFQHTFITGILSVLPAAVPMIASLGGALGALLPILGIMGGQMFAMASAIGLAAGGWVAFGALAASALGDVFDASKDIDALNEKLKVAKDEKERVKILEDIADRMSLLSTEQQRALESLNGLKSVWADISGSLEGQVVTTFALAMDGLASTLENLRPLFESVAEHAEQFVRWLNFQIDTEDVQAFFDLLNTRGGPAMFNMTKGLTNFAIGIANMMVAFDPLVQQFEAGFVRMSESFRDWSANLGASDKFKAFIDYVSENGPKLLEIIGNIVGGFVGMGIAFAPFAEKMLDGLVEMTEKFEEWGYALSENEGFQEFIAYVEENGPKVLDFLREFRNFLINVAIAFAPLGEKVMEFLTYMFELANGFMENNRQFSELLAVIMWGASVFAFFLPFIVGAITFIQRLWPAIKTVWGWFKKLWPVIKTVSKAFGGAIGIIGRVIASLVTLAGWPAIIIAAIIGLAVAIIYYWDEIKAWTVDMVDKMIDALMEIAPEALAAFLSMKRKIGTFFANFSLYDSGKALLKTFIRGVENQFPVLTGVIKGAANLISRFLPNSPAKEGPLRDLDRRDFAGPLAKSIMNSRRAVQSAMSNVMSFPDYAVDNEIYMARSAGYRSSSSEEERELERQRNERDREPQYAVINIGGHEAKGIIQYVTREQDREKHRDKKFQ